MVGRIGQLVSDHIPFGSAQCVGLSFATAFCNGLGKIGEQTCQPQDHSDRQNETAAGQAVGNAAQRQHEKNGSQNRGKIDQKHNGVLDLLTGRELYEGIADGAPHHSLIHEGLLFI